MFVCFLLECISAANEEERNSKTSGRLRLLPPLLVNVHNISDEETQTDTNTKMFLFIV
jgi:hypothetical protein